MKTEPSLLLRTRLHPHVGGSAYEVMDCLRAVAAALVVISHVRSLVFIDAKHTNGLAWTVFYAITGLGHESVMIFFVLSGFWITKSTSDKIFRGDFSWRVYLVNRLSRLWLVLIPALLLGLLTDVIGRFLLAEPVYLGRQGTNTLVEDVALRMSLSVFLGNLVFLQTLVVPVFGSNGPLWSLANEFWYYIWFPLALSIISGDRSRFRASIILVITLIGFHQLIPGFLCWLSGSALFFLFQYARRWTIWCESLSSFCVVVFIFSLSLLISRTRPAFISPEVADLAVSLSFAGVLLAILLRPIRLSGVARLLARFGAEASYSLYVTHFPALVLLCSGFGLGAGRMAPGLTALSISALMFLLLLIYSAVFASFTEVYTSRVRNWLRTSARFSPRSRKASP